MTAQASGEAKTRSFYQQITGSGCFREVISVVCNAGYAVVSDSIGSGRKTGFNFSA